MSHPQPNCRGWINIYRSGFFHTAGKPGAYDRHPGDIYATEAAARGDIAPRTHYVATIPIEWYEPVIPTINPRVNEEESIDYADGGYLWLEDSPNAPTCTATEEAHATQ